MNDNTHDGSRTNSELTNELEVMVKEGKLILLPDGRYDFTPEGKKEYMAACRSEGVNPLKVVKENYP